jgi:retron-type reverse transcriptase
MYKQTKSCVKIENKLTHFFESRLGVKQGDNLSPNLFKIFINSLPDYLEKTNNTISIEDKSIQCLMYADDIVLLSKSSQGLHEKLNKLKDFCNDCSA